MTLVDNILVNNKQPIWVGQQSDDTTFLQSTKWAIIQKGYHHKFFRNVASCTTSVDTKTKQISFYVIW
jgi:hypothetical protein